MFGTGLSEKKIR